MRNKAKSLILASIIGCVIIGSGFSVTVLQNYAKAEEDTGVYSIGFDIMGGKDVMPLGVFFGPDSKYYDVENGNQIDHLNKAKYFDYMVDAKLNMVTVSYDYYNGAHLQQPIMESLDLCLERNIGYFMHDYRVESAYTASKWMDIIKDWINHPAVAGVHFADEPKQVKFEEIAECYRAWDSLQIHDKSLFTNLYATGCSGTMLSGTSTPITIEEYYRSFIETVKPPMISSDIYPFRSPNQGTHSNINFLKDMSLMRRLSKEYKIAFWTYVAAGMQHNDAGSEIMSTLPYYQSEGEMLWNINIPLAYGCTGISYFTYFQPDHYAYAPGNDRDFHRNGILGVAGNKNQWYYYVRKANTQIAAIDHILMNASSMGVIPVGTYADRLVQSYEKISSFRELTGVTGEDFIVGCFDYLGKTALYVVNNSSTEKHKATLKFSSNNHYTVIQRAVTRETDGKDLALTLETGEGVMVVVD